MDAAAKKAVRRANAPQWKVAVGVGVGLALAAAPLAFKEVRAREQSVAQMRDAQYDKQVPRMTRETRGSRGARSDGRAESEDDGTVVVRIASFVLE